MRVLLTALAIPGFALGLVIGATHFIDVKPLPPSGRPTSVVWADRVYVTKHDFAQWLRSRGKTYQKWAAKHPASAEILDGRHRQAVRKPTKPSARRLASQSESTSSGRPMMAIGLALASVLGLVMLVSTLRRRLPAVALTRQRLRVAPRRRRQLTRPNWKPSVDRSLVTRSVAASRAVLADLDQRLARPNRPVVAMSIRDRASVRLPEVVRLHVPDIAFCFVSVLLAVGVGVSLALYLS